MTQQPLPSTDINEERDIIAYNASYSFAGAIADYLITFFVGVLLARFLGSVNYGLYSLAITIWATFVTLSSFGINGIVQYGSAKYKALEKHQHFKWTIEHYLYLMIAISIILSIVMFALAGPIAEIYKQPQLKLLLEILAFGLTFYTLTGQFSRSIFSGYQKLKYTFVSKLTFDVLRLAQIAVLFLGLGLLGVIEIYPLIYIITGMISLYLVYRLIKPIKTKAAPPEEDIKELRKYGLFTYTGSLISLLYSNLIIILLGAVAPSVSYVAYYRAALIVASLLSAPAAAISGAFFATTTKLFIRNEYEKLYSLQKDIVRYATALTSPLVFGSIAFASPIVTILYHSEYLGAVWPFIIIVTSVLITTIFAPLTVVLGAIGKQKYVMYSTVASAITGVVSSAVLIPLFASNGAAITYFLIVMAGLGSNLLFTRKYIHIKLPVVPILKTFAVSLVMIGIDMFLYKKFPTHFDLIFVLIFGLIVYFFLILLSGAIKRKDLIFIAHIFGLNKYIKF